MRMTVPGDTQVIHVHCLICMRTTDVIFGKRMGQTAGEGRKCPECGSFLTQKIDMGTIPKDAKNCVYVAAELEEP